MDITPRRSIKASALLRHLGSLVALAPHELRFLEEQTIFSRQHAAQATLHAENDTANQRILISGWAARQRLLPDGRRQIVSFILPGDIIGPLQRPGVPASCASVALTWVETADASTLLQEALNPAQPYPALRQAFQFLIQAEDIVQRDQIVRLGRQTAFERTIHLILELRFRLTLAGLADDVHFALPLTQDILADALGLSLVHANRTLQQIRREGLMELRAGRATILQFQQMAEIASWTPTLGLAAKPE